MKNINTERILSLRKILYCNLTETDKKKLLTPNHPISASPPQFQTPKLLLVGALMSPAAKWAPRSAVHGWTRPVKVPKSKAVPSIIILSML